MQIIQSEIQNESTDPAGSTAYTGDGYATGRTHKISAPALTTTRAGSVVTTVHLCKPSGGHLRGRVRCRLSGSHPGAVRN